MMDELQPPKIPERIGNEAICWHCKHAVPGNGKGCSWSKYGKPVPGWVTIDGEYKKISGKKYIGHKVQACPLFEKG